MHIYDNTAKEDTWKFLGAVARTLLKVPLRVWGWYYHLGAYLQNGLDSLAIDLWRFGAIWSPTRPPVDELNLRGTA